MQIEFPADYPHKPFFVRLVSPRCVDLGCWALLVAFSMHASDTHNNVNTAQHVRVMKLCVCLTQLKSVLIACAMLCCAGV